MGNENGTWIMHGLPASDPDCIRSPEELISYIGKVGFLPLFANTIPGFSVEEHTESAYWWSGDAARDPWEWREQLARSGRVVYGKFFDKKAGFLSLDWLPVFANARRGGYDFDALWDDEKCSLREKKIMDVFSEEPEILSNELKLRSGFGKDGEKNFDGILTELQMQTYLCVCDFRRRKNQHGAEYGWPIAVCSTPEHIWGYDAVTACYGEPPETSRAHILAEMHRQYPDIPEKQLLKLKI